MLFSTGEVLLAPILNHEAANKPLLPLIALIVAFWGETSLTANDGSCEWSPAGTYQDLLVKMRLKK